MGLDELILPGGRSVLTAGQPLDASPRGAYKCSFDGFRLGAIPLDPPTILDRASGFGIIGRVASCPKSGDEGHGLTTWIPVD